MPSIDYPALRAAISMEQVLRLLAYEPTSVRGRQLRGPCPIHDPSATGDRRCFSVHLGRQAFRCFACGVQGHQLDLWQHVHRLPLYESALALCRHAHLEPPWSAPPRGRQQAESRNSPPPSPRPATG